MFIGREKELAQLEQAYSSDGFSLFVINGPRGAGKTTLLEEFFRNKSVIYFTATQASSRSNLNAFSRRIFKYFDVKEHEPFQFWDSALSYIARMYKGSKIIVILDDFDTLAIQDVAFIDLIARIVEGELRYSKMLLAVVCRDARFIKGSNLMHNINGIISLGKFLNEENIAKLQQREMASNKGITQAKFVKIPADTVIIHEGEKNDAMYKIISGRAICSINHDTENEYILSSLNEGKTFGEYSLITSKPGIYTVTAFTDMLLLKISRDDFASFIEMNVENSVNIVNNMAVMMNVMKINIDMLNGEISRLTHP